MAKIVSVKTASKEWDALINRIRSRSTPMSKDTAEDKRARKKRAESDPFFFMATYLPHYVDLRVEYTEAWKHPEKEYDWIDAGFPPYGQRLFDAANLINKMSIIAGFRESAKSTIVSRADVLHKILFKKRRFIMFIAASEDRSLQYTTPLKLELENNLRIRQDFGNLVGTNQWTDGYFRTSDGVATKGMGIDQNIRGENDLGARIDHLDFEDVEDLRSSKNPDQIVKYVDWIKSDALFAVNSTKWSGVYICNYESKRSIAHEMLAGENTKHFNKIILRALEPNLKITDSDKEIAAVCTKAGYDDINKSVWEYRHTTLRLKEEERDDPIAFRKARMQSPKGEFDRDFDDAWFQYYNFEIIRKLQYRNFGFYDPMSGKKSENNQSKKSHHGLIVISVTYSDLDYYVRRAIIQRGSVIAMLNHIYSLEEEFSNEGGITWGCEDVAFQAVLEEVVEMMAKEKGRRLDFHMVPTPTNISKEDRILKKQRLVQRGFCKFDRENSDQRRLLRGFLDFPEGSSEGPKDGPDSWERCITFSEKFMGSRDKRKESHDYESVAKREAVFEDGAW